ncbi:unnamed protein product [Absidia cylindrospora]
MYSYNWTEQQSTRIFNSIFSMAHQQHMRSNVLNSILHQKMGLFHHSLTMENIAHHYLSSTTGQEKTLVSPRNGHHHQHATTHSATFMKTSTKTADEGPKATKGQSTARPALKKTKSELKVITHATTPVISSTPTTPGNLTVSEMSIQNIICMDLPLIKMAAVVSTPGSNTKRNTTEGHHSPHSGEPNTRKQRSQKRALSYGGGGHTNHVDPLSMANPELNYVLMDTISNPVNAPEHNMLRWKGSRYTTTTAAINDDLLRRHGIPYLDTYLQHASLVSVHQKALQVYLKWRKRFGGNQVKTTSPRMLGIEEEQEQEQEDGQEKLTRYEVSEILRSSRLLHFCRAPFFFFTGDQHTQQQDKNVASSDDVILDWYRQFLRTFVVHYSAYLEKLNLQVVEFPAGDYGLLPSPISTTSDERHEARHPSSLDSSSKDDDSLTDDGDDADLNTSKFDTGIQGLTVEHPSTYLLKVSDAGSIICEVRFTHTFVSVSLYGLHRQRHGLSNFQRSRQQSRETKRMHFKKFEQGVGQLKHLIHINSFVYDFHLYYMQHLLTLMSEQPPPCGVSVMGTLRRFNAFYITPAHYSTNRLFSGVYECKHHHHDDVDDEKAPFVDLSHFFKYLYKDHVGYGLHAVRESHNDVHGVYLTSTSVSFDETDDAAAWKYTLVLCPMTEKTLDPLTLDQNPLETPASVTSTSVLIRYFILAVYQPERTPSSLVKNFWTTPASSSYHPSLIVNARKKIDGIVSKVIKTCKQRFSWRALLPNPLKSDQHRHQVNDHQMDCSHWYQLLLKFQYFSLLGGDTPELNLVRLVNNTVDWHQVFNVFLRMYQDQCRSFMYKARRHILVYDPRHYMDFLIHIMLGTNDDDDRDDDSIEMEVVRRVPRFTTADDYDIAPMTEFEQEQVAMVGQSLCYILWKDTKQY